jgi:hypothetical protein
MFDDIKCFVYFRNQKSKDRHGVEFNVYSRENKLLSSADGTVKSTVSLDPFWA